MSKKLHIQNVAYFLLKHLSIGCPSVEKPEIYLDSVLPEKRNSCLCSNFIDEHPQYDLEIIIPVYNAAKYLDQCVQSLIHQQTCYRYKAIFINDGSTDNSLAILEKYRENPHVTIINTLNQGVSAARNVPLQNIHAKYVMFVDSDDYLTLDAVEKLLDKAEETEASIVEGNHRYFEEEHTINVSKHIADPLHGIRLYGMACGKVYRAEMFKQIHFPYGVWFEDTINWLVLYQMTEKMEVVNDVLYHYRSTPTGFSKGYNQDKRRVETYWVTKQLLLDAQKLGIKPTMFYYETFLRQCQLNTRRVAMLGDRKADFALFEAHRQLRDTYFKDMHAQGEKEKRIESALLNDDFKEYLLYCLFLY